MQRDWATAASSINTWYYILLLIFKCQLTVQNGSRSSTAQSKRLKQRTNKSKDSGYELHTKFYFQIRPQLLLFLSLSSPYSRAPKKKRKKKHIMIVSTQTIVNFIVAVVIVFFIFCFVSALYRLSVTNSQKSPIIFCVLFCLCEIFM